MARPFGGGGRCHRQSRSRGWCGLMAAFPSTNPGIYSGCGHGPPTGAQKSHSGVGDAQSHGAGMSWHPMRGNAQCVGPSRAGGGGRAAQLTGEGWPSPEVVCSPRAECSLDDDTARFLPGLAGCCGPALAMSCQALRCPARQDKWTPKKLSGAEEMDGWKMLEKKMLACLRCHCLTLMPLSHQLPAWLSGLEDPSTALFPGQRWSSCLLSSKKRFSGVLDFKATTMAGPGRAPGSCLGAGSAGASHRGRVCALGWCCAAVGRFLSVWAGCVVVLAVRIIPPWSYSTPELCNPFV